MLQPSPPSIPTGSATERFGKTFAERPVGSAVGLGVEYGMFASGLGLAAALFVTRVPLRLLDRAFGLRLRERFVDLLARISPG